MGHWLDTMARRMSVGVSRREAFRTSSAVLAGAALSTALPAVPSVVMAAGYGYDGREGGHFRGHCAAGHDICCTDLGITTAHCGTCGHACTMGQTCCHGTCVDQTTDSQHCGACGHICPPGTSCAQGLCCAPGQIVCNGVCVDPSSDPANCGVCGNACALSVPNGFGYCSSGICAVFACQPDYAHRAIDPYSNGCDINVLTDPYNCGSVGHVCAQQLPTNNHVNAVACQSGQCVIATCAQGYADCNGVFADGCEAHLAASSNNCGTCNNTCPSGGSNPNGTIGCASGNCAITTCSSGYADCNGDLSDGCETDLLIDSNNCGACGNQCPTGLSCCGGACVNVFNDSNNCNACGHACGILKYCSSGLCCPVGFYNAGNDNNGNPVCCASGSILCNGACTDIQNDKCNCGSCGNKCGAENCTSGHCCPSGSPYDSGQGCCYDGATCIAGTSGLSFC